MYYEVRVIIHSIRSPVVGVVVVVEGVTTPLLLTGVTILDNDHESHDSQLRQPLGQGELAHLIVVFQFLVDIGRNLHGSKSAIAFHAALGVNVIRLKETVQGHQAIIVLIILIHADEKETVVFTPEDVKAGLYHPYLVAAGYGSYSWF